MDPLDIQKADDPFSGNELDDLDASGSHSIHPPIPEGRLTGRRWRYWVMAMGLSLLLGAGFLYLGGAFYPQTEKGGRFPIDWTQIKARGNLDYELISLNFFVLPLKDNKEFTYISLSISFKLPNRELERKMTEEKYKIRGVVYETLCEELNKADAVPSLERMKAFVIKAMNRTSVGGDIQEIFITEFLIV